MTITIAVDGPTASGKGTLARRLAHEFDLAYLDTGSLYRAVALKVLRLGGKPSDPAAAERAARSVTADELSDPELRTERTGNAASVVAALPGVRQALLDFQRDFAARPPSGKAGAVLDGRDIGTVVCPEAAVKLFITASPETRAERRFRELDARGEDTTYEKVLANLRQRDARDSQRQAAPLKPAADAVLLDTTELDIEAAFSAARAAVAGRLQKGAR